MHFNLTVVTADSNVHEESSHMHSNQTFSTEETINLTKQVVAAPVA